MSKKAVKILLQLIVVAILVESIIAMNDLPIIADRMWQEKSQNVYPALECYTSGYDIQDSKYVPSNNDPQIGFSFPEEKYIQSVVLLFNRPIEEEIEVQVYYATDGKGLSEWNSVHSKIRRGAMNTVIQLPAGEYTQIRLDINGSFALSEVYTSAEKLQVSWPFNGTRLLLMWAVMIGMVIVQRKVLLPHKTLIEEYLKERWQTIIIIFILAIAFTVYFILAINLPMDLAPDEDMRNDIPFWMYEYNMFPVGNEVELLNNNVWGFSYGFTPCRLPAVLAWVLMHIFAIFSEGEQALLLATRLVSVLSCVGSIYLCYLIGRKYFKNLWSSYFYAVFVGFLPQIVFLSSYYNSDTVSLFGCCLILYNLVSGREAHWPIKTCIGLSIGLSVCLLSYFNSYGWVLLSVIFCLLSCFQDKTIAQKAKFIGYRVLLVALIVLALSGWSFLRNAVLYEGDFLAREVVTNCKLEWEAAGHTIHRPTPPINAGISLWDMLTRMGWSKLTAKSFIAGFGGMSIFLDDTSYCIYALILIVGLSVGVYSILGKKKDILLFLILSIAIVIPVVLSIIYSYTSDYQAQGRYLMPMLPALAMIVVQGYDYLTSLFQKGRRYYIFSGTPEHIYDEPLISVGFNPSCIGCCLWFVVFIIVYWGTMVPQLFR